MLLANAFLTADHLTNDDANNEGMKVGNEKTEHTNLEPPAVLRDNLCDRINQLWSNEINSEITFAASSLPPEHDANLERILSSNVRVSQWTCGHWRCLVYVISRITMRTISFAWYIEQALILWLLRVDLHPVTLRVSDKLLENNVLGGVLTGFYQISRVLILIAVAHFSSRLLFIRLTKVERIKQALQDLAVSAPVSYKGIIVFIQLFMPNIPGFLFIRATSSWNQSLTTEILSYTMEIVVILIICIMGYRLLLEVSSNSKSSLKTDIAPESGCQDTLNLEASALRENKAPQGRSEYPQLLTSSRFQIFRLAISIPTMIVWVCIRC
ncbi:uncharacterized protein N7496_003622 [Penicillium cataractarum]|uniref:Uncharacterized protein n=1 Tax=Penicillium cataractarum TaxID=2100454 RepID=A0A9W9SNY8_9EURO|nr:uncharacterized protein N7496_003622 [Penicillium cataractarum]KAJ5381194.1 hypothetical protein N7496_003622 [Penicillium cataractarum]